MIIPTRDPLPLTQAEFGSSCSIPADAKEQFKNARAPEAAYAGLLLRLGHWELSHDAASAIATREGAYWHAILHRTEPDLSNAAYWYRRVGYHPIFPALRQRVDVLMASQAVPSWKLCSGWDPSLFLRWTGEALGGGDEQKRSMIRTVAQVEWDLLFEWCASP